MPVENKIKILSRHPYLRLRLVHAAIGTFPCHSTANIMTVNRWIIVLSDSGNERSVIRDSASGEHFLMRPHYFCFVPCNHPSDWDFSPELRFVSLQFNLEQFYGFDVFRDYHRCFTEYAPDLANELQELIHRDEEVFTLCRLNEIIYHLCVRLLARQPGSLPPNVKWQNYEKVLDYIRKSGDATTTVQLLAEMLKMRNNVFSRKFTHDIGITPKDFLLDALTRKASEILLVPGSTVKQTATQLKFSSEYYFSGFFKKQTGMSPREFQRNHGVI